MSVRAIILAGGRGTRLDPLTRHLPKPLVPFFDQPIIAHQIRWLATYGFNDIVISLGHLGDLIESVLGSERDGARLRYVREDRPLGTAGAVAFAARHFPIDEPVLVIPGDCLADYDLGRIYQYFVARPEAVGLVVRQVDDPRPFGVVAANAAGRVLSLVEKPRTLDFGRLVNTGIYVLKPQGLQDLPHGHPADFAYDVFPQLIAQRRALSCLEISGYWSDIGTLTQYRQSHFDVMNGRFRSTVMLQRPTNVIVDPGARIIEPVWLGEGVVVEAQATIGPYAVIGEGSRVGPWTKVDHSVIGKNVFLGAGSRVNGATVADRVVIGGRCRIGQQAVIGSDTHIGWGTSIGPGSKVGPGTRVSPRPGRASERLAEVHL